MTDSFFIRSFTAHVAAGILLAGGMMMRKPSAVPAPEPTPVEMAEAEPTPPQPKAPTEAPAPLPPPPPQTARAATPPPTPITPAATPAVARQELERQGAAFFTKGGSYEALPLRWNRMEPSQSQFLYSTRASIWVYSEATHCYVAKAQMTAHLTLEVTPLKGCSENPAHAVGGRIQAKNAPFDSTLAQLIESTGDDSLVLFSDHRNGVRRYIAGVVMSALQSSSRKLEDVGQILLEGAVKEGEPIVRVIGLCDRDDNCS